MTGGIQKAGSLTNPWASLEVMARDDGDLGKGDGLLTLGELTGHIDRLAVQRKQLLDTGLPTGFVDVRISQARQLFKDMVNSGAAAVQYLPDSLMGLAENLRRRASELLVNDDLGGLGEIDSFVIQHARDRYQDLASLGSAATSVSASKALAEIDALAIALGLT
ncbi:MAG: hypothetical protein U1E65_16790 [Myxococcota bacterium]